MYDTYEALLADDTLDIIDIATPTFLHAPMSRKAAEKGRHVHCEKPFCRTLAEGLAACAAAHSAGVRLMVGETYVFLSSHVKARELIEAGEIGRPLQVRQRHGAWLARESMSSRDLPRDRSWRLDPERSGGGSFPWIFDHAVHFFAAAEYFVLDVPITEIYALTSRDERAERRRGATHDPYRRAEIDIPAIVWQYEDPACQGLWVRAERLNGKYDYRLGFSTSIIGEHGMIEVLGEGGGKLFWEGVERHLVLHREGKETVCWNFDEGGDEVWDSTICYYSRGHINQVHHFVDSVLNGSETRYPGEQGVQAVRCTLAAILSAQRGEPVRVADVCEEFAAYENLEED
jgi:predicted dehydrogenase